MSGALLACGLSLGTSGLQAQQQRQPGSTEARWERLEGCRLLPDAFLDGDSFHALRGDREYAFRLYFVDAPEGDPALADRVHDQAVYFGISVTNVPHAAKLAADFTRRFLGTNEFTVLTRWQNAMGRGRLARFYAVVFVNNSNLAEALVANGLARIHGLRANWPGGPRSATFLNQLKNLELAAREQQRGVWNTNLFPRVSFAEIESAPASPRRTTKRSSAARAEPLDLNTASQAELESLPGVGPVLAGRIIAHRPYKRVEDLDAVPGIGPATLKRLRPLVRVSAPSAPPDP